MTKLKGNRRHHSYLIGETMSINEIPVTYEPFKEIVVKEKIRFRSPEELARFIYAVYGGKSLFWIDGVVFQYIVLAPSTSEVAKEMIEKDKVYWTSVFYAMMPKYALIIETKEKFTFPVVEITSYPVLKSVVKWLKEQKE
jgi:hypothetical protein